MERGVLLKQSKCHLDVGKYKILKMTYCLYTEIRHERTRMIINCEKRLGDPKFLDKISDEIFDFPGQNEICTCGKRNLWLIFCITILSLLFSDSCLFIKKLYKYRICHGNASSLAKGFRRCGNGT